MGNTLHDLVGKHHAQAHVPAHAAATATEKVVIWQALFAAKITDIKLIPSAAITGANTNTTHVNIVNEGTDGAGTTELDNWDFVSGTDGVEGLAISGATTDVNVAAGDVITAQIEKVGTGLALPVFLIDIEYEAR